MMTINASKFLQATLLMSTLSFAASFSTSANAAQGCGHGFHRVGYGQCVPNHYRGGYHTVRSYRHCWRNAWGRVRCR